MWLLIFSFIVISIVGTLSHFLYDISNNKIVGLFSAVNESTWEHVKIALTLTLLWGLVDEFIYGTNSNYFLAKFVSLLVIIILMPALYYGHKAIIKKNYLFLLFGGYMIHTLMPAKCFLFKDPMIMKFGYKAHSEEFSIMKNKK